jgi:hypothetical protein
MAQTGAAEGLATSQSNDRALGRAMRTVRATSCARVLATPVPHAAVRPTGLLLSAVHRLRHLPIAPWPWGSFVVRAPDLSC